MGYSEKSESYFGEYENLTFLATPTIYIEQVG